jgi:hypothetical protein
MVNEWQGEAGMSRKQLPRVSVFFCAIIFIALVLGSCLNPVSFDESSLPRIKVDVTGSISINDVAVLWLINRTKTIDVTSFTVTRDKTEDEAAGKLDYQYPKEFTDKPKHQESLATYHVPTVLPYTISVTYKDGAVSATKTLEAQFPRALDYKFYLYKTSDGSIHVVNEDDMKKLPANPEDNIDEPVVSSVDAQSFVVINVTGDQDVDEVSFVKTPYTFTMAGEPCAKDQMMFYLSAGSYRTAARYTKDDVQHTTGEKNVSVALEYGSMAVKTNFLYFYKTKAGDYQLSQRWPPLPNDAADDNAPEDVLTNNQGILRIVNEATPGQIHALVSRVDIDGTEFFNANENGAPDGSPYITYKQVRDHIVGVGSVYVSFMPTDNPSYGLPVRQEILSKQITTLVYTGDLANPETPPADNGYGAGLIRITNNSTGVVVSAAVYDSVELTNMTMGYDDFIPQRPIQYTQVGRVPVVGTQDLRLKNDDGTSRSQIIQVVLETDEGVVVVERSPAYLHNNIYPIIITQDEMNAGKRIGSQVIVENKVSSNTAAVIRSLRVSTSGIPNTNSALYTLNISNGGFRELYVLSSIGLPILQGVDYEAALTVFNLDNGETIEVSKSFAPDGYLYSTDPAKSKKTITLTDNDLPSDWKGGSFVPLTKIDFSSNSLTVTSYTKTTGNTVQFVDPNGRGTLNLSNLVPASVEPPNATKTSPIVWGIGNGKGLTALADNVLTVTGIPDPLKTETVTLTAVIPGAGPNRSDYTKDFTVTLNYVNAVVSIPAVSIDGPGTIDVAPGQVVYLSSLLTLAPQNANKDGVPITVADLVWSPTGSLGASNCSLSGNGEFKADASAAVGTKLTVTAVLPAEKNSNGAALTKSITVNIVNPGSYVPVSKIDMPQPLEVVSNITVNGVSKVVTSFTKGSINLNLYAKVEPSSATNKAIEWSSPSNPYFTLSNGTLTVEKYPADYSSQTVKVTAVIKNGATVSSSFSADFDITLSYLVESTSNPVKQGGLKLNPATIRVGDAPSSLAVLTQVNLPGDFHISGAPITADKLSWKITSGKDYAALSGTGGQTIAAVKVGSVQVEAVLPADYNGGTQVTAATTITVQAPPPPSTVLLRIFQISTSDSITQIVLQPADRSFSTDVQRTGRTGIPWVSKKADRKKDTFKTAHPEPPSKYYSISIPKKAYSYADVAIPYSSTGYYLYFIEGDTNVRGYCLSGNIDPAEADNYLFFLNPDFLYNSYSLWMKDDKEAAAGAGGAVKVIPIGYRSYYNTTSIMKSAGIGQRPDHDSGVKNK